jgi:autotransporter-associated beta strand protein
VGLFLLGGFHSAFAAPAFYWRGGNGNWSDLSKWAESAGGSTAYNAATYGDVSFNTSAASDVSQVVVLDADRTFRGLDFSTAGTTTIIGNVNRALHLYEQINVNSGSGAVTIGSTTSGQKVSLELNSQPNTWTNNSTHSLTIQNDVLVGQWSVLTVNGTGNTFIHGVISQSAGNDTLAKAGPGILTLAGNNTYMGTTVVTGGTLVVNGNQNAATGALTVSGGGTRLVGSGTIGGNTTIGSGAVHSPGAPGAVGKQTFDQPGAATTNLTYSSGSIFSWNIDRTQSQTRGLGYDAVDVTGSLTATSGAIFQVVIGDSNFSDAFWNTPRTWSDIFTNGSSAISNWATIFNGTMQFLNTSGATVSPTGEGSFSLSGNTLSWAPQIAFVPEPTSALVGLLIGAGLLRRRRGR